MQRYKPAFDTTTTRNHPEKVRPIMSSPADASRTWARWPKTETTAVRPWLRSDAAPRLAAHAAGARLIGREALPAPPRRHAPSSARLRTAHRGLSLWFRALVFVFHTMRLGRESVA